MGAKTPFQFIILKSILYQKCGGGFHVLPNNFVFDQFAPEKSPTLSTLKKKISLGLTKKPTPPKLQNLELSPPLWPFTGAPPPPLQSQPSQIGHSFTAYPDLLSTGIIIRE